MNRREKINYIYDDIIFNFEGLLPSGVLDNIKNSSDEELDSTIARIKRRN